MFAPKRIALLLAFGAMLSTSAQAEPVKLIFATTVPAGHGN